LLYGDLTAEENLEFYARMYNLQNVSARVDEVLALVGLQVRRKDLLREFSRGMQQRLAIGRAILHNPSLLLFDEPHTGLDQEAAAMLDNLLREVAAQGRTVVMTSHDLLRVPDLASRVDILSKGKIRASLREAELDPDKLPALYRSAVND
jgi:heme exporter protein A